MRPSSLRRARARLHARRASDDSGVALIFVILITSMVMVLVSTTVSLTASNIAPSRRTADIAAAFAAAQGGLDEFEIKLQICGDDYSQELCPGLYVTTFTPMAGADGLVRAAYSWHLVVTPALNDTDVLRVQVTGRVNGTQRSLVADYRPTPSFLDYLYFTEKETVSPELAQLYNGPRVVQLPTAAFRTEADKISSTRTSVTWGGVQGTEICDLPWYDSAFAPGRSTLRAQRGGNDYSEATNSPVVTRYGGCDVVFTTGMTMSGKVYSKDAFYFSNGTSGGAGPMFLGPVRTEWGATKVPAPPAGKWYRSVTGVGGDPATGSQVPRLAAGKISMPAAISGVQTAATCVFTGPTRVKIEGAVAVVTSPNTTAAMLTPTCVPSGAPSALTGTGLVQVRFPITQTTSFYVKSTTPIAPAGPTNPVFDLRNFTIGPASPAVPAQPGAFYSEMNTAAMPINAVTLKAAALGGPLATQEFTTLTTWLNTVNAQRPSGVSVPQYTAVIATPGTTPADDPLLEAGSQAATVQRRMCTLSASKVCLASPAPSAWVNAFTVTRASYTFPLAGDVTPYNTGEGSAFVEGTLTGKLTVAAEKNLVITNDTEDTRSAGIPVGTLGLVADSYVQVYHPVKCATVAPVTVPGGTCPDDITGLYSGSFTFETYHPSRRYLNMRPDLADLRIDAAVLARQGSFTMQNYMRGTPLDFATDPTGTNTLTLTGGVYQKYRGPTGVSWDTIGHRSGYVTSMIYDPRLADNPPPNFVEPSEALIKSAWLLLGVSGLPAGG